MNIIDKLPFNDDDMIIINVSSKLKKIFNVHSFNFSYDDGKIFNLYISYGESKYIIESLKQCNINIIIHIHPYNIYEYIIHSNKIYKCVPKAEQIDIIEPSLDEINSAYILSIL